MAQFNPQYVNLNGYEAAQLQRMANRQSPLDAALQGLNQGVQLGQLPQTLQDQELQRQLKNAITIENLNNLRNPDAAFNRKLQQQLIVDSLVKPNTGIYQSNINQPIANPGALTPDQQTSLPSADTLAMRQAARDAGGVDISPALPKAPAAGLTETPITGLGGKSLNLMLNPNVPKAASQEKADLQTMIAMITHPDRGTTTSEVPIGMSNDQKFIITQNKNTGAISKQAIPGVENTPAGQPTILPLPGKGSQERKIAITGNEVAKAISEAGLLGISYDPTTQGDLTVPANYGAFKKQINDATDAQGSVSDPKLKQIAIRVQQNFNKEPVVVAKKNMEIFGKEAATAIQDLVDNPGKPAGADQQVVFDSFLRAFASGKPTAQQYGVINQYQSWENTIKNIFNKATTGVALTPAEFQAYNDAITNAVQSITPGYQDKVKQYRDEVIGYGVKPKASEKIIKSESSYLDAGKSASTNESDPLGVLPK